LIINTNPSIVSDLSFTATGHNKQEPKHTIGVVGACSPRPLALYFTASSNFSSVFINVDEKVDHKLLCVVVSVIFTDATSICFISFAQFEAKIETRSAD
jgi:hypothetical protein